MQNIWIDTALLAIPNFAIDEDLAHELFLRIIAFESLLTEHSPVKITISDRAELDLWSNHCGPGLNEIKEFLELMNLQHVFVSHDLVRIYQTLLSRAERSMLGPNLEVRSVDYFKATPLIPAEITPAAMRRITELAFATVLILNQLDSNWNLGSALPGLAPILFNVKTVLTEVEGDRSSEFASLPLGVTGAVRAITRFEDTISEAEAIGIWTQAQSVEDVYLSIAMMALLMRRKYINPNATAADLSPFSIGPRFWNSLIVNQCAREGRFGRRTLSRCAQLVGHTDQVTIGTFGKPDRTSRSFDNGVGSRVHISGGHVGLRLMFWQIGRAIEFANVGPKFELIIEHGQMGAAFVADTACLG